MPSCVLPGGGIEAAGHPGVYPRGPATALEFLRDRPSWLSGVLLDIVTAV